MHPSVRGRDDQQRHRSVVEGAGVARRDSPARLEDRLEFGELAGSDGDRYDLIAEALLVLCGNGLPVAPQGDAILALAGDIVPGSASSSGLCISGVSGKRSWARFSAVIPRESVRTAPTIQASFAAV
jgi:hypothetical protein